MKEVLDRAFRVSDGLVSLTQKKVNSLVKQLQNEGVLTKREAGRVISGLSRVKKSIYESVSGRIKRELEKRLPKTKKSSRKKKASRKRTRR